MLTTRVTANLRQRNETCFQLQQWVLVTSHEWVWKKAEDTLVLRSGTLNQVRTTLSCQLWGKLWRDGLHGGS